jgi:AraC-like DNA-binding protein
MKSSLMLHPPQLEYADRIKRPLGKPIYFAPHHHQNVTELLLLVEGEASYVIGGREYSAGPGTLICFNQGVWHEERSAADKPFQFYYLGFSGLQLAGLPANTLTGPADDPVIPLMDQSLPVRQRMEEIVREWSASAPESALIGNSLLTALIGGLLRVIHHRAAAPSRKASSSSAQAVALVKRYIEEHYSMNITLEQLAGIAYVSPYHLCHLFRQELGCSPIRYVIHCRIEAAQYYLSTTEMTVDKIAKLVGYESETYFHNAFKKRVGLSPGEFRSVRRMQEAARKE